MVLVGVSSSILLKQWTSWAKHYACSTLKTFCKQLKRLESPPSIFCTVTTLNDMTLMELVRPKSSSSILYLPFLALARLLLSADDGCYSCFATAHAWTAWRRLTLLCCCPHAGSCCGSAPGWRHRRQCRHSRPNHHLVSRHQQAQLDASRELTRVGHRPLTQQQADRLDTSLVCLRHACIPTPCVCIVSHHQSALMHAFLLPVCLLELELVVWPGVDRALCSHGCGQL